jgi:hypothetical protein
VQIGCYADVQRAVAMIGLDVNPGLAHERIRKAWWLRIGLSGIRKVVDGRDEPGHDSNGVGRAR